MARYRLMFLFNNLVIIIINIISYLILLMYKNTEYFSIPPHGSPKLHGLKPHGLPHSGSSHSGSSHSGSSHSGSSHSGLPHSGLPHSGLPHKKPQHHGRKRFNRANWNYGRYKGGWTSGYPNWMLWLKIYPMFYYYDDLYYYYYDQDVNDIVSVSEIVDVPQEYALLPSEYENIQPTDINLPDINTFDGNLAEDTMFDGSMFDDSIIENMSTPINRHHKKIESGRHDLFEQLMTPEMQVFYLIVLVVIVYTLSKRR